MSGSVLLKIGAGDVAAAENAATSEFHAHPVLEVGGITSAIYFLLG